MHYSTVFQQCPWEGPGRKGEREGQTEKSAQPVEHTHTYTATRTDLNGSIKLDLKIKNACD